MFCDSLSDFSCLFSFGRQRERCRWCCERLSETLHPLVAEHKTKDSLSLFDAAYDDTYLSTMRAKVGNLRLIQTKKQLVEISDFQRTRLSMCSHSSESYPSEPTPGFLRRDVGVAGV